MRAGDKALAEGILFTDQYQLTMAQLYFRQGLHEETAQFDHFFRDYPKYDGHRTGYCVNAGLAGLVEWMEKARFGEAEIDVLSSQLDRRGQPLFDSDFLEWLREHGNFDGISLSAIPEGRVVHPHVPLTTVQGPLAMAQILETSLLNHLNYQTLIATKAARVRESTQGGLLLEFGLRRAHGFGANAGARAAMIGGADFTSNVGMSHVLGYPPKGTHAHSMVQVYLALGAGELDAFRAFAEVYPDDCILLVDTIDTLESGVPNAIRVFEELRNKGHDPVGIRLDSGDLAYLSIQASKMLDEAGFPDVSIVLSNNLDELIIWQIITQIRQEAPRYGVDPGHLIQRLVYGVGTRLITSWGEPALNGVYKLVGVRAGGRWIPALKLSESADKVPIPGRKRIWRLYDRRGKATADLVGHQDEEPGKMDLIQMVHPVDPAKRRRLAREHVSQIETLHASILEEGQRVYDFPQLEELRDQRASDIARLDPGVRRLLNPHIYHVSLTERLSALKVELMASAQEQGIRRGDDEGVST